jgi:hypothetical protein
MSIRRIAAVETNAWLFYGMRALSLCERLFEINRFTPSHAPEEQSISAILWLKIKVTFTLEHTTKDLRLSIGIGLLFL